MRNRRWRKVAAAAAAAIGVLVPVGTASADHYSRANESSCSLGPEASGIPVYLTTTNVRYLTDQNGNAKSFTCEFSGIPAYLPPSTEGAPYEEFYLPTRGQIRKDIECMSHNWPLIGIPNGGGTLTIRSDGTATVRCSFTKEGRIPYPVPPSTL